MVLYISLTVLVVLLALGIPETKGLARVTDGKIQTNAEFQNKIIMGVIFALLTAVSICRIAVGNDYWGYKQIFFLIESDRHVSTEIGFNTVVKIMQFLFGSDNYLVIFGLFGIITVWFLIRAVYEQSTWVAFSIFLLMTGGYYFLSMASVRYYFALSIGLYAAKYAVRKEWGKLIVVLAITSLFHMSVWILLPVYWAATREWKKWTIAALSVICVSLLIFEDFYRSIIFIFYEYYEGSVFDNGQTSIVNIIKCFAILIFGLIYYKKYIKEDAALKFYFNLNLFALILYVFGGFIPEVSRIGYYMHISNIFFIPGVLCKIEDKRQKWFFGTAIALAYILYFAFFLKSCYDIDVRLLPYRTWIFD